MLGRLWIIAVDGLLAGWFSDRFLAIILGVLFAALSIALIIASWTRWGQNKPVTMCVVLSILAHVWLLMYAYGTRIILPGSGPGRAGGPSVRVQLSQEASASLEFDPIPQEQSKPVTELPEQPVENPLEAPIETSDIHSELELVPPIEIEAAKPRIELTPDMALRLELPTLLPPPMPQPAMATVPEKTELSQGQVPNPATSIDLISPKPATSERPIALSTRPNVSVEQSTSDTAVLQSQASKSTDQSAVRPNSDRAKEAMTPNSSLPQRAMDHASIPEIYQLRMSASRSQLAAQFGGDPYTEQAVETALVFLASIQAEDGNWDAAAQGAGRETQTLGFDRSGTGGKADTGMTGLALLSFLGAGYTHGTGPYTRNVQLGLDYLIHEQMPSGDLAGRKQIGRDNSVFFARMYCHGIACLALAEAYALTGDQRLVSPLTKAAQYTLRAQNPRTGGWRYAPYYDSDDDPGDLSQFGWQAMALNSCTYGGFQLPQESRGRMKSFLESVAAGSNGGLAVYRPMLRVPKQVPTPAMTAEALASRLILGWPLTEPAEAEARSFLLSNLPGSKDENLYYWYYATLALFQFQDRDWNAWNNALKTQLLSSQIPVGNPSAGSWNPTDAWGGYGGRVYSTSMACMCLEVYYRYLPMYRRSEMAQSPSTAWSR